jgi:hypothetical protein
MQNCIASLLEGIHRNPQAPPTRASRLAEEVRRSPRAHRDGVSPVVSWPRLAEEEMPARRREQGGGRSAGSAAVDVPMVGRRSAGWKGGGCFGLMPGGEEGRPALGGIHRRRCPQGRALRGRAEGRRALRFDARWGGREAGTQWDLPPSSSLASVGSRRSSGALVATQCGGGFDAEVVGGENCF